MAKFWNRKKNKIKNRKSGSIFKDNRFILTTVSISLGIILVTSNVILSRKTYEIISLKKQLDTLTAEKKDLNEEVEAVLSPIAIKDRALKLDMVEVESIEELLELGY